LHVSAFDRAVHCRLQCFEVGDVDVIDVDAFLGQQRCQLAQHLVRQPGLVFDPRQPGR